MAPGKVEDTKTVEQNLLNYDISYPESQTYYSKWAQDGTYDKMLRDNADDYNGLLMFTQGMRDLFTDKSNVRVLDLGAGTGLSGEKLREVGYTNIDGLEPCASFVKVLQEKGTYVNVIGEPIGFDRPLDVADDTYDAICVTGSFAPSHIPWSAFSEMVRITKPGGFILNCMREEYLEKVDDYREKLVPLINKLRTDGRLEQVEWTRYPNHFARKDGIRMVFKVL